MISKVPNYVLSTLDKCIDQVKSNLRPYATDPISDFTRERKLNFEQLVKFYLQLQAKSNNSELNDYFTKGKLMPSSSALGQAKGKVSLQRKSSTSDTDMPLNLILRFSQYHSASLN